MTKVRAVVLDERKSVETGYEKEELKSVVDEFKNSDIYIDAEAISLTKVV